MTSYAHPELLVEPDELASMLDAADVRVLDSTVFLAPAKTGYRAESGRPKYEEGHVPGAAFMDLIGDFSDTTTGLGFSLPGPGALATALGRLGVGNQHHVVVYSTGHMMWATRAFWLLRFVGHERVAVLNGGFAAWKEGGHPTRSGTESYPPTTYAARSRPELFVGKDDVRAVMNDASVCTVNALSPEVYAGTGDMHYGRRGHIPGSRNLYFGRLLDGQRFRQADELRAALTEIGMLDAPRVVTYCGGGISATLDAFACLLVGKEDVAVYDGSMSEWARDESLPLKTGNEP